MTDTIARFRSGVHEKKGCGKNKGGFAALQAEAPFKDTHVLGNLMRKPPLGQNVDKKRSFGYSDSLAYIIMKLLESVGMEGIYIILMSSESPLSSTVKSIMGAVQSKGGLFIVVRSTGEGFQVTKTFGTSESSIVYETEEGLLGFFSRICVSEEASVIAYPTPTPVYIKVIQSCTVGTWCVPALRSEVFKSKEEGRYRHSAFPWSRYPHYSGYTMGTGPIVKGTRGDAEAYEGSFNAYLFMVSSAPVGNTCIDCFVLRNMSESMDALVNPRKKGHRHTLSDTSVKALEEASAMLRKQIESLQGS